MNKKNPTKLLIFQSKNIVSDVLKKSKGKTPSFCFFLKIILMIALFSIFALVLTLLLMKIFVDIIGVHYLLARIIILFFTGLLAFSLNYVITFRMAGNIRDELRINY